MTCISSRHSKKVILLDTVHPLCLAYTRSWFVMGLSSTSTINILISNSGPQYCFAPINKPPKVPITILQCGLASQEAEEEVYSGLGEKFALFVLDGAFHRELVTPELAACKSARHHHDAWHHDDVFVLGRHLRGEGRSVLSQTPRSWLTQTRWAAQLSTSRAVMPPARAKGWPGCLPRAGPDTRALPPRSSCLRARQVSRRAG
jgi:hypothetical protein